MVILDVFVLIYILRNLLQAFIRILEAAILFLSTPKGEPLNRFCVSSSIISYVSFLIGELGMQLPSLFPYMIVFGK